MTAFVWVDGWQQECCGRPFKVGGRVEWPVVPLSESSEWLVDVLGCELGSTVGYWVDHHDDLDELSDFNGVVRSIHMVHFDTAPLPADPRVLYPTPGSAQLVRIEEASGIERHRHATKFFGGYLVEVEPESPPHPYWLLVGAPMRRSRTTQRAPNQDN